MKKDYIDYIIVVLLLAFASFIGVFCAKQDAKRYDFSRDESYEAYIEYIYENDINYFYDVIAESDEFISYCERHPEWAE